MTGAGLTREVWQQFIERFGDLRIIEGMGATESNCALSNPDGKIGAVGRVPYPERSNARLVRYDVETDDYLRDEQGFLIECQPGEPGDRKSTRMNSSHVAISYAVFCLKKKTKEI